MKLTLQKVTFKYTAKPEEGVEVRGVVRKSSSRKKLKDNEVIHEKGIESGSEKEREQTMMDKEPEGESAKPKEEGLVRRRSSKSQKKSYEVEKKEHGSSSNDKSSETESPQVEEEEEGVKRSKSKKDQTKVEFEKKDTLSNSSPERVRAKSTSRQLPTRRASFMGIKSQKEIFADNELSGASASIYILLLVNSMLVVGLEVEVLQHASGVFKTPFGSLPIVKFDSDVFSWSTRDCNVP